MIVINTKEYLLFFIHKTIILYMKQFLAKFILQFNITIWKQSQIENLYSSKNNCQSFYSTCDNCFVGNGRFFYLNYDGKLDIYYIVKIIYPGIKKIHHLFSLNALK